MTLLYTLTIFTSAFLLLLIQPMISKLLLPQLGGSPAVWNTAMMFFQTLLLLGYLYAHFTSKWLGAKKQSALHIILLLVSIAWLPVALKTGIGFSSSIYPIGWVIVCLFMSVGIPFFLLSANAPLVQFWLSQTHHKDAQNPYFLYSASNVGSLLALLSYPVLIEPLMTLPQQTNAWSVLYILFIALITCCAWQMRKHSNPSAAHAARETQADTSTISIRTKAYWVALAFAPSSLMLGLTTFVTTDLAALPLFWVIPLALYLITFIFAFGRNNARATMFAMRAQIVLAPIAAFVLVFEIFPIFISVLISLLTFFATAMVCHGTLAQKKPSARTLTEYYVWISFGGMLGGVFNSLIAPNIFIGPIEYGLVLIGALLLRPTLNEAWVSKNQLKRDVKVFGIITILLAGLFYLKDIGLDILYDYFDSPAYEDSKYDWIFDYIDRIDVFLLFILCLCVIALAKRYAQRSILFTLIVFSVLGAHQINLWLQYGYYSDPILYEHRNFFGTSRIYNEADGTHLLMHGTTTHGIQSQHAKDRLRMTTYYAPLPQLFTHLSPVLTSHPYAVIGLGVGTSACAVKQGQDVDFYEIDPVMIKIALHPQLFTYLRDCPPTIHLKLGDGRLMIAKAEDHRYGIIIVDAFSSDSIPMHLITREALAIYKQKLANGGIIAFHISNRFIDLQPVVAGLAEDAGLHAYLLNDENLKEDPLIYESTWIILTNDDDFYTRAKKARPELWYNIKSSGAPLVWTDNYSNILGLLYWDND